MSASSAQTHQLPEQQAVLVLVGLIGSGKSTFAQALEQHTGFVRCNQDDLGDRRAVETLARNSLRDGLSVCIDRTNVDATQRSHWIKIAREFPGVPVWVVVFDTPYNVCADRLRARTGHPTIHSASHGLSILSRFASTFQRPTAQEGYDRIISLTPQDHPASVYTAPDVNSILRRVRESTPIISASQFDWTPPAFTSRGTRPYRGGYRGGYDNSRGAFPQSARSRGSSSSARPQEIVPSAVRQAGGRGTAGAVHNERQWQRTANRPPATEMSREQSTPSWRGTGSGSAHDPYTVE